MVLRGRVALLLGVFISAVQANRATSRRVNTHGKTPEVARLQQTETANMLTPRNVKPLREMAGEVPSLQAASPMAPRSPEDIINQQVLIEEFGDHKLNTRLIKFAQSIVDDEPGLQKTNRGGWHSQYLYTQNYPSHDDVPLDDFLYFVKPSAMRLARRLLPSVEDVRFQVNALWAVGNRPGTLHVKHRHANELKVEATEAQIAEAASRSVTVVSGVYYVEVSPIMETHSLEFFVHGNPIRRVRPKPGRLVLFPSWLEHAMNNESELSHHTDSIFDDSGRFLRLSFAFNAYISPIRSRLEKAASNGDASSLAGAEAEDPAQVQRALEHAVQAGHAPCAERLLQLGGRGEAQLLNAALAGHRPVVEALARGGVDLAWEPRRGESAARMAAGRGHAPVLQALAEWGGLPLLHRGGRGLGKSLLTEAVTAGHLRAARLLLELRMDPNGNDTASARPIHEAALVGSRAMVTLLAERKADLEARTLLGRDPLYLAAGRGHVAVMELLHREDRAEPGPEPRADARPSCASWQHVSDEDQGPLHAAALGGHAPALAWLLERRAEPERAVPSNGAQALHLAASEGHAAAVTALLEAGAPPDALSSGGLAALHVAASRGHGAACRALLSGRATVDLLSECGTALHVAAGARVSSPAVVETLLLARASVHARTSAGETPLHRCAMGSEKQSPGRDNVLRLLLKHRADVSERTTEGKLASELTKQKFFLAEMAAHGRSAEL